MLMPKAEAYFHVLQSHGNRYIRLDSHSESLALKGLYSTTAIG